PRVTADRRGGVREALGCIGGADTARAPPRSAFAPVSSDRRFAAPAPEPRRPRELRQPRSPCCGADQPATDAVYHSPLRPRGCRLGLPWFVTRRRPRSL